MGRNTFAWGTQVGRSDDGPIPFLQYSPRLRHVAEFLFDLERWRDQRVVVLAIGHGHRLGQRPYAGACDQASWRVWRPH